MLGTDCGGEMLLTRSSVPCVIFMRSRCSLRWHLSFRNARESVDIDTRPGMIRKQWRDIEIHPNRISLLSRSIAYDIAFIIYAFYSKVLTSRTLRRWIYWYPDMEIKHNVKSIFPENTSGIIWLYSLDFHTRNNSAQWTRNTVRPREHAGSYRDDLALIPI